MPVYETKKVQTGTKQEAYTEEVEVTKYKTETYIIKYESQWVCEDSCQTKSVPVYGTRQVPYTTTETVTKYRTVPVYETKKVQTGTKQEAYTENITVTKYKEVPVYKTITVQIGTKEETHTEIVPVITKVTYYRSKTREYIAGKTDTKWSTSQNDEYLLSQGYSLTGNSRKI